MRRCEAKDVPIVSRVGDDEQHRVHARVATLQGKPPAERLHISNPGLGLRRDRPAPSLDDFVPRPEVTCDPERNLSQVAQAGR